MRCLILVRVSVLLGLLFACSSEKQQNLYTIYGYTFGTSYSCKYIESKNQDAKFRLAIDSLLHILDRSMSTYIPESLISRSNSGDTSVVFDQHFIRVFRKSKEVHAKTNGFFDPTVGVLRDLLPFGTVLTKKNLTPEVQERKKYIGFDKVKLNQERKLVKTLVPIQIDFNAIAKGYAVDVIARYMHTQSVSNFLIEIGGEVRTRGKNLNRKPWKLGIEKPLKGQRALEAIVALNDESLATSGNYRKYYITEGGDQVVHTINPKSGLPFPNDMRSASVIAKDCITADAYATAFMAMGFERSKKILEQVPELEVFFLYQKQGQPLQSFFTAGFRDRAVDLQPHE